MVGADVIHFNLRKVSLAENGCCLSLEVQVKPLFTFWHGRDFFNLSLFVTKEFRLFARFS